MHYNRLIAACSGVCTALRSALLGPDSGALWQGALLSASYPGLNPEQTRGLHALAVAQGHFMHSLVLYGGG